VQRKILIKDQAVAEVWTRSIYEVYYPQMHISI